MGLDGRTTASRREACGSSVDYSPGAPGGTPYLFELIGTKTGFARAVRDGGPRWKQRTEGWLPPY